MCDLGSGEDDCRSRTEVRGALGGVARCVAGHSLLGIFTL